MRKLKLIAVTLVAGLMIVGTAQATTLTLQNYAQAHGSLLHQYSFDGADVATAGADLGPGGLNLKEHVEGVNQLAYDVAGWDATSNAGSPFRENPGVDRLNSDAWLTDGNATLGTDFSFEAVIKVTDPVISGGTWNLGYILSNRGSGRGYFLMQGGQDATGDHLQSMIGSVWGAAAENPIVEPVAENHWYYVAGSYVQDTINDETTFVNFVADLTAGDTTLTTAGPITVAGTYEAGAASLGIGKRYDGASEAFPGLIDEMIIYKDALVDIEGEVQSNIFQIHLDALLVPEPATMSLLVIGGLGLIARRRRK